MIWSAIGNKWFDKWISSIMNLHDQLDSCACDNSPLTYLEKEELEKAFKKINKVNTQIAKRLNKGKKK